MRRKIVTIRDVAEQAGVSVSTVSHVLNGNDQHVSSEKRDLVLAIMDRLKYRPNAIARSMVKQKTATIGLVISEIDNPLFVPVTAGVEEILRPAGYHIVLASAPDVVSEKQAIETLRSQQVDGFIFMALSLCYPYQHLVQLKEEGVPFVVINRCLQDQQINQVSWDDRNAAYQATRHLLQLGHTRIGTISGPLLHKPPRRSALERHRGWLEAMQEFQLPVPAEWIVDGNYTYEGGFEAIKQLLARVEASHNLPGALFVATDIMAVGALKALNEAHLSVPDDIAIIAMGDPPFAAYTIPALSTMVLPVPEAGRRAARILLEALAHGQEGSAVQIALSCTLQIRESCGALKSRQIIVS
jgi:LacI family transcriptional regulator